MYSISVDLENFGQYGALLLMLFPSIITEICIAQNGAGAHQSPSNLFSCPESGLKFTYFAIKIFQLFFTVQRWQSGIALRKAN